jgi:NAD(P)-dependent dehydrogenase (short-subunit alcohol dehydrogenase family)
MAESSKNVFITGASAGIGEATARLLAERGYTVFAGVRTDNGTLAEVPGAEVVAIDVTDPDSVATAAAVVTRRVGRQGLAAVINNAGVIVQGPLELVPPAELRRQFDVNTLGPAYVTQAFLPLLRAGRGRVINISAPTARVPVPFMAPISASKAALASISDALRVELAAWKIPVVVVEPGGTATEIFAKADAAAKIALAETDGEAIALYQGQLAAVAKAAAKQKPGPVAAVARVVVTAVGVRKPKRRYSVGPGARSLGILSHLPDGLRDRVVSNAFGLGKIKANTPA